MLCNDSNFFLSVFDVFCTDLKYVERLACPCLVGVVFLHLLYTCSVLGDVCWIRGFKMGKPACVLGKKGAFQ